MVTTITAHSAEARKLRNKYQFRRMLSLSLDYGCMTLLAIFFLFPVVFMVVSSFKPEKVIFDDLKTVTWAFLHGRRQPRITAMCSSACPLSAICSIRFSLL